MGEEALKDVSLPEAQEPQSIQLDSTHLSPSSLSDDSSSSSPTHSHSSFSISEDDHNSTNGNNNNNNNNNPKTQTLTLIHPAIHLPKPEPPHLTKTRSVGPEDSRPFLDRSISASSESLSTFSKFLKDRSTSLSTAITKHISTALTNTSDEYDTVTEFHLSGLKVIVNQKNEDSNNYDHLKGRISFFSRSNCRDSTAVRKFFREKNLPYVEINVDVFPEREKELKERTGTVSVPQIFFNEKPVGGLVVLNSLRNSGEFEGRLREMLGKRCPEGLAPRVPVYGFDEEGMVRRDGLVGVVRVLRQRLPIQDRLMKMKIVKNCFAGSEMVEGIIQHLDCGRKKVIM